MTNVVAIPSNEAPRGMAEYFSAENTPDARDMTIIATLRRGTGEALLPLAQDLRERSCRVRGHVFPAIFFDEAWEDDSGAYVLEVTVDRRFAQTMIAAVGAALAA